LSPFFVGDAMRVRERKDKEKQQENSLREQKYPQISTSGYFVLFNEAISIVRKNDLSWIKKSLHPE